jgi:hypothetical protein
VIIQSLVYEYKESFPGTDSLSYEWDVPFSSLQWRLKNRGSYGTSWGTYEFNYSGQANGDFVNVTLMQPDINSPLGNNVQVNSNKEGGVWESGKWIPSVHHGK